jgi:hypothetical protein
MKLAARTKRFFVVALIVLSPSITFGQAVILRSGTTSLSVESKFGTANVVIQTNRRDGENGGVSSLPQNQGRSYTAIKDLNISVNNHPVFVARSVFADLVAPREASLRFAGNRFVLEILGGDASESYFLHIDFDNKEVNRRTYYSALVPDKPTQETYYWSRVLEDE